MRLPPGGVPPLFQIGIKPLDISEWIDVDAQLPAQLDEKARLAAAHPDEVFVAEAGTEAAQAEVLALLVEHLPQRFPDIYRRDGETMAVAGRNVPLSGDAPLRLGASLVQEDLVIMRRAEQGWRLAAGSLSFPSSWHLREKFGRPMHEVHAPVPGFGAGTRNNELIGRMFDNLRPEMPVIRWNWSVYGDDALYHPHNSPARRFGEGEVVTQAFFRVERQTLRRLPESRDILFTIRIHLDPLAALERSSDSAAIATGLIERLDALDAAQLDYKGLTLERDRLLARLRGIAAR